MADAEQAAGDAAPEPAPKPKVKPERSFLQGFRAKSARFSGPSEPLEHPAGAQQLEYPPPRGSSTKAFFEARGPGAPQ